MSGFPIGKRHIYSFNRITIELCIIFKECKSQIYIPIFSIFRVTIIYTSVFCRKRVVCFDAIQIFSDIIRSLTHRSQCSHTQSGMILVATRFISLSKAISFTQTGRILMQCYHQVLDTSRTGTMFIIVYRFINHILVITYNTYCQHDCHVWNFPSAPRPVRICFLTDEVGCRTCNYIFQPSLELRKSSIIYPRLIIPHYFRRLCKPMSVKSGN